MAFRRFHHKLLAAFVFLILLIIVPVVIFVNSAVGEVSDRRIEESVRTAQRVLEEILEMRRATFSDSADVLAMSQPSLRALLGTSNEAGDVLFAGAGQGTRKPAAETAAALYSTVESLDLYQRSGLFVLTDAKGTILFSKAGAAAHGRSLADLAVPRAALAGKEQFTLWGTEDPALAEKGIFFRDSTPRIFEVFFKPIAFGPSLSGLLVVGFPLSLADISRIRDVTQSEIAFYSGDRLYAQSSPLMVPSQTRRAAGGALTPFRLEGEEFLSLVTPLKDSLGQVAGTSVIFRSRTREMAPFLAVTHWVNLIAVLAAVGSVLIAFLLARDVRGSIAGLIEGTERIRKGDLAVRVTVPSRDEFERLASAFNTMTEGLREKERIKSTFQRYVSPRVVSALLASGQAPRLGGERRQVVVFAADMRGFTSVAEGRRPEEVVGFLNEYLSAAYEAIEAEDGIVDKFVGDAVLAYWIVTANPREPSIAACRAALAYARAVAGLRGKWADRLASGFGVRIGLHAGEAIMGNIGSESRLDYTIIGDTVNATARLETANKAYGSTILLSEPVADAVGQAFALRELDTILVPGKERPMRAYELLGDPSEGATARRIGDFAAAMRLYRARDFAAARDAFRAFRAAWPDDPVAQVFFDRAERFAVNPPAKDWDGVYRITEK